MSNYLIEGIDRLGKGTLIEGIKRALGGAIVVHYEKPLKLDCYQGNLELYQVNSFRHMFYTLNSVRHGFIMDRAHLGEAVYAKRYRDYDGNYVFNLETYLGPNSTDFDHLILLTSSDTSWLQDDGLSFDFAAKDEEQEDFKDALRRSNYKNKLEIDVCLKDSEGQSLKMYAPKEKILDVVLESNTSYGQKKVSFRLDKMGDVQTRIEPL